MANDKNIHHFTASDIERYHRGQLSAKEMHDLEKASLDDPFLADALEGYTVAGVNADADLALLKKRLGERVEGAKVIPLQSAPRNSFRMLRAAVMILFIAGAGLLVYKFGFDNKNQDSIAKVDTVKEKSNGNKTDTAKDEGSIKGTIAAPSSEIKPAEGKEGSVRDGTIPADGVPETKTQPGAIGGKDLDDEKIIEPVKTVTDIVQKPIEKLPAISTPAKSAEDKIERTKKEQDKAAERREQLARQANNEKYKNTQQEIADATDKMVNQQNNRSVATGRKADNQDNYYYNNANTFRGRVTDAENRGVPFANVTNVQDNNAGTYTDARGNFNLTYPDSVLTVQVRSIGFENTNVQLRNSVPTNQVVMQDDRKGLSEVVLSNKKVNATRSRDANMKIEEPEPADGWENYDVYLVNNLNIPEDLKSKQNNSGAVEISFEVDKNGEPTNIKVEKSLCSQCDKEAIRLIKEGPKWKRKARKGRTTVTISF